MMSLGNLVFLFCAVNVRSFLLPGSCPEVPATHFYTETDTRFASVLFSVPFYQKIPSFLFPKVTAATRKGLSINFHTVPSTSDDTQSLTVLLSYTPMNRDIIIVTSTGVQDQNESSIELHGVVYDAFYFPIKCHEEITETVRLWFDADYLLIWSCVDENTVDYHEEALLISLAVNTRQNFYDARQLRSFAGQFVSQILLNQIDWTGAGDADAKLPFECPAGADSPISYEDFWILVVGVLLFLGLLVVIYSVLR